MVTRLSPTGRRCTLSHRPTPNESKGSQAQRSRPPYEAVHANNRRRSRRRAPITEMASNPQIPVDIADGRGINNGCASCDCGPVSVRPARAARSFCAMRTVADEAESAVDEGEAITPSRTGLARGGVTLPPTGMTSGEDSALESIEVLIPAKDTIGEPARIAIKTIAAARLRWRIALATARTTAALARVGNTAPIFNRPPSDSPEPLGKPTTLLHGCRSVRPPLDVEAPRSFTKSTQSPHRDNKIFRRL